MFNSHVVTYLLHLASLEERGSIEAFDYLDAAQCEDALSLHYD